MTDNRKSGSAPTTRESDLLSFWEILARLIQGRTMILVLMLVLGVAGALMALLPKDKYTVDVTFRPEGNTVGGGRITTLASQFGVDLGGEEGTNPPQFYAELVKSRALRLSVASRMFSDGDNSLASLPDLIGVAGSHPDVRLEKTIHWMERNAITVNANIETRIIKVSVETPSAELSRGLAAAVLEEVDLFNSTKRRTQAVAERMFLGERLEESSRELAATEESLKAFLQANRLYKESPELRFEHDRLERAVQMRQQLHTSLYQAMQQAQISEVRNTPVITVLQDAYVPPYPDRRRFVFKLALGIFTGLLLGMALAMLRSAGGSIEENDRVAYEVVVGFWKGVRRGRA